MSTNAITIDGKLINIDGVGKNTPCAHDGVCHDCTATECVCCQVLVTRMSREKDRIKVILVGEELGY